MIARDVLSKAVSEDELLTAITEAATFLGWRWVHFRPALTAKGWRTPTQGHTGFPDLVLARNGVVLFWELKSEAGEASPDQLAWMDALEPDGWDDTGKRVIAKIVRPSDLDAVLEVLR